MKIYDPNETSKIAYAKPFKEVFETATGDTEATKFYQFELDYFEITPEIKGKIWDAIGNALAEARISPYIILVPKSWVTRKRIPYEEIPIPFAQNVIYLIPYIKKITILERWNDKDDE